MRAKRLQFPSIKVQGDLGVGPQGISLTTVLVGLPFFPVPPILLVDFHCLRGFAQQPETT